MEDITENVARGIKLLNEKFPNWRKKIDVAKLDMNSCNFCILGQLYEDYGDGLTALFREYTLIETSKIHGFTTDYAFDDLTKIWVQAINI